MARLPVHEQDNLRQKVWDTIRRLGRFTWKDLNSATKVHPETTRTYLRGLENAGYIEQVGRTEAPQHQGQINPSNRFTPMLYRLINDVGAEAPRVTENGEHVTQGCVNENMWRTIRILNDFDFEELAATATTDECEVKAAAAKDYCKMLSRAGYLITTQKGSRWRRTRYRLLPSMNTGPRPPQIQRVKHVYDANQHRVVWPEECTGGKL